MECNVLVSLEISSKVNNIRSEQFQFSEKYIVLVFIIYSMHHTVFKNFVKIELKHLKKTMHGLTYD